VVADLSNLVRLTKAQVKPAAEMMARAFQDYPLMAYFFPDESERMEMSVFSFQYLIRYGLLYGEVYATSPNLEGAAVWLPSDKTRRTLWRRIRSGLFLGAFREEKKSTKKQRAFGDYVASLHERRAPSEYRYLQLIGVDPVHQGKGYSSILLESMFARLDKEHMPSFLETHSEKNVAIYQHHDFRVVEESEFPGSGLITWAMLRDGQG
jgi:GNAT superfamily N-acetyltransferase